MGLRFSEFDLGAAVLCWFCVKYLRLYLDLFLIKKIGGSTKQV